MDAQVLYGREAKASLKRGSESALRHKPLGIEKSKKFEPDARQKKILEQGAVVGEAMARANTYAKPVSIGYLARQRAKE